MASTDTEQKTLILGIEGGGTTTTAFLARLETPEEILGRGTAGPSNQRVAGPRIAMASLEQAVQAAFEDAGIERQTVEAACLGLAGADRESDRNVIEDWARGGRLAYQVQVVNDVIPLLYTGDSLGSGIALISGTGSLAWGRNAQNQIARSGGWGYLIGDEGSEYALGRAVLQAVTWSSDGRGPVTCLVDDVLAALQLAAPADIVTAVYSHEIPRAVIARLAPLVFEAASRMDIVSCDILTNAATELASMVTAVARRLKMQEQLSLSLTGSVLLQQTGFRTMVLDAVASRGIRMTKATVVAEPARGALHMARILAERQTGIF